MSSTNGKWQHRLVIPAIERWRQVDQTFKTTLGCILGLRLARMLCDPVSRKEGTREGGRETSHSYNKHFVPFLPRASSPKSSRGDALLSKYRMLHFPLFYCLLAQKVRSCQYFGFLLVRTTPAFLTVNSLSSTLGAKLKYPTATT